MTVETDSCCRRAGAGSRSPGGRWLGGVPSIALGVLVVFLVGGCGSSDPTSDDGTTAAAVTTSVAVTTTAAVTTSVAVTTTAATTTTGADPADVSEPECSAEALLAAGDSGIAGGVTGDVTSFGCTPVSMGDLYGGYAWALVEAPAVDPLVVFYAAYVGEAAEGGGVFGSWEVLSYGGDVTCDEEIPAEACDFFAGAPRAASAAATGPSLSALDSLAPLFAAAQELDAEISAAAQVYNRGFNREAGTVSAASVEAIQALDTTLVRALIPAGMEADLEAAVLAVYADLDSRIAALDGGIRYLDPVEGRPGAVGDAMGCLGIGSSSNARFDGDVAAAQAIAATYPPVVPASPESEVAGMLQARLAVVDLSNWGCDSCGGAVYDAPIAVDWDGRTVDGIRFDAVFDGTQWSIEVWAC